MKMMKKGYKRGGKMPDLSGDGEVTQEDVLIGRGVLGKNADAVTKGKKAGSMPKPEMAKKKSGPMRAKDPTLTREMIEQAKTKTPAKKMKGGNMVKKGYAKGGKVRGAGIARQGVRPCKMR